jgi:hypothetical protein
VKPHKYGKKQVFLETGKEVFRVWNGNQFGYDDSKIVQWREIENAAND